MEEGNIKKEIAALQAHSLRDLLEKINAINFDGSVRLILRDDIVSIQKLDDTFVLIYYR